MIILSVRHGILTKRDDYKINKQYELSPVHKRYLMCLANRQCNSSKLIKQFVYGKNADRYGDYIVGQNIQQIKSQYHIKIQSVGDGYILRENIGVMD